MYRRAVLTVATIAALLLNAATASAEPTAGVNREVSGPFVGTTFFDFFTSGCSFIHQTLDGTYTTTVHGQTGTFHLDVCPTFGANGGSVAAGRFTVNDRRGSTLIGTVTGTYDISTTPVIPFVAVKEPQSTRPTKDIPIALWLLIRIRHRPPPRGSGWSG